jgi:membrane-associated phospholipid phosphatase
MMVLLGYIAGASWKQVAHYATQVGIALFLVVLLTLILGHLLRTAGNPQSWAGRQVVRLAGSRPASWLRWRFPGQLGWLAARFQTGVPAGCALTVTVLTFTACAWSLGSLTSSVIHHINSARFDPRILSFFVGHHTPWLTRLAQALTWLGSGFVLWPVVIAAGLGLWWSRRRRLPAVLPALSLAGAGAWCLLTKVLVGRPRPPAGDWLGAFDGWSYPSQHAAQALAAWGMLALMVMAGRSLRTRTLLMTGAALIAFVVGLTRLYLAAHWMTDVLAGWALAGVWDCLLIISYLFAQQVTTATAEREARPAARQGAAGPGAGGAGPFGPGAGGRASAVSADSQDFGLGEHLGRPASSPDGPMQGPSAATRAPVPASPIAFPHSHPQVRCGKTIAPRFPFRRIPFR